MMKRTIHKAIHFNEMLHMLAVAEERRQTLNIKVWKTNGEEVELQGWLVHHDYWRGGYVRFRNPQNGEIRMFPEIFIHEINNQRVFL